MNTVELCETLMQPAAPAPGRSGHELLNDVLQITSENRPVIETLPCGWGLIDDTLGGLPRGEFLGIVGGPGVGKSMLADQVVVQSLELNPDARAMIFALETAPVVRMARLLAWASVQIDPETNAITSCCPLARILRGELRDAGKVAAQRGAARLAPTVGRVRFVSDVIGAGDIANVIEGEQPDVVLVDHLGLVVSDAAGDNETTRFDACLGRLTEAIRRSNAAAVIINELGKTALRARQVGMAASRGSVRFASLAALFVGLMSETEPEGTSVEDPTILAQLVKSRFGVSGMEQRARFLGGLAYFCWGGAELCKFQVKITSAE